MKIMPGIIIFSLLVASCTLSTSAPHTSHSVPPGCNSYCDFVVNMNDHLLVFPLSFNGFVFFYAYKTDTVLSTPEGGERWKITFEYRRNDRRNQKLKLYLSNALGVKFQPSGRWKGTLTKRETVLNKYMAKYERLLSIDSSDHCSLFWHVGDVSMLLTLDVCDMEADNMAALTNNLIPVSRAKQMCESTPSAYK